MRNLKEKEGATEGKRKEEKKKEEKRESSYSKYIEGFPHLVPT
jgi:hypothetical protein